MGLAFWMAGAASAVFWAGLTLMTALATIYGPPIPISNMDALRSTYTLFMVLGGAWAMFVIGASLGGKRP
jgi:hypothetical protein